MGLGYCLEITTFEIVRNDNTTTVDLDRIQEIYKKVKKNIHITAKDF